MTATVSSITRAGAYEPFDLQVARGQVYGHSTVNIFGANGSFTTTGTYLPVWENLTAYTYPVSAAAMHLASTVNTGADKGGSSVTITGLDANYDQITETLTLNGTTAVVTTKLFFRINGMQVASGVPTGTITLKDLTNTTVYAQITAGNGRSQMSIFTVPAGYTFYLMRTAGYTSLNGFTADYAVYRDYAISSTGVVTQTKQNPFTNNFISLRVMGRPYAEKTDIQYQVKGSAAQFVNLTVEGYLIKNDVLTNVTP